MKLNTLCFDDSFAVHMFVTGAHKASAFDIVQIVALSLCLTALNFHEWSRSEDSSQMMVAIVYYFGYLGHVLSK